MCPESHTNQLMWLEALRPMIAGDFAAEGEAAAAAAGRGGPDQRRGSIARRGSITSMMTEQKVLKEGWLHRASEADSDEGGEWFRRYFRLVTWWRDGAQECELEYHLDAELNPDEDTDTVELHPSSSAEALAEGERGRPHCLQLRANTSDVLLSADSEGELQAWLALFNNGWVEAPPAAGAEVRGRTMTLKPKAEPMGRTGTLLGGKTSSLMPGARKGAAPAASFAPGKNGLAAAERSADATPALEANPRYQAQRAAGMQPQVGKSFSRKAAGPLVEEEEAPSAAAVHASSTPRLLGGVEIVEEESPVVHTGYMAKKGDHGRFASWKSRWFVLHKDGGLTYADSEGSAIKGRIDLANVRRADMARTKVNSSSDYSFHIKTPGRKWMLNPGTEKAFDEWEQKLMAVMKE